MKILLYGDSITDMYRQREEICPALVFGCSYPIFVAGDLYTNYPKKHQVINRGIGGNRTVDLYARIKMDVWNHNPDVLSILVGINDIWHETDIKNGVDIVRFEKVYRMIIEDTIERLPNIKIMLLEPFVLPGEKTTPYWDYFKDAYDYAKVVKKLAEEYNLVFVPLQERISELAKIDGNEYYLYDGVHPTVSGAKVISEEWLKAFKEKVDVK